MDQEGKLGFCNKYEQYHNLQIETSHSKNKIKFLTQKPPFSSQFSIIYYGTLQLFIKTELT